MSLHRVGSLENFLIASPEPGERSRRGSSSSNVTASERARKLSFNPLPESWEPVVSTGDAAPTTSVGAFEIPQWKRILQVVVTVIYCLFAAGVVFGYAALKPVLVQEGAYRGECDGNDTCVEIRLNLMFTTAAVATNVAALPVGAILDHFGPRVSGCIGAMFLTVGAILMSFAQGLPFDGLLLGYLFLALGGPFTYISSFQLSNAFPRNSGFILALLTGAFDASSALFLAYRIIFERTGGSFGHQSFFQAYLVVPVVIIVLQLTILPSQSYKTVGEMIEVIDDPAFDASLAAANTYSAIVEDQVDEHTALLREEQQERHEQVVQEIGDILTAEEDKQIQREETKNERSGVWGIMHQNTALEQIRSLWFWLICLFTVVQMTRINYFMATIRPQYEAILHSEPKAVQVNKFFDVALPVGGILSIPFIGLILDNLSTLTTVSILVLTTTLIGILGVLPFMWAAYANVCLFVLYRPFYYTAVSDYAAKVFGFRTFGTVYGTIICLSGLFNFSQSGLDYLFHVVFRGDPVPVNLMLLGLGFLIGVCLVAFVGLNTLRLRNGAKRNTPGRV